MNFSTSRSWTKCLRCLGARGAFSLPVKIESRQPQSEQHMLLVGCLVTLIGSINIKHKQSLDEQDWPFCCNSWWLRPRYFYLTLAQMFSSPDTQLYLAGKVVENALVICGERNFFSAPCKNRLVIN